MIQMGAGKSNSKVVLCIKPPSLCRGSRQELAPAGLEFRKQESTQLPPSASWDTYRRFIAAHTLKWVIKSGALLSTTIYTTRYLFPVQFGDIEKILDSRLQRYYFDYLPFPRRRWFVITLQLLSNTEPDFHSCIEIIKILLCSAKKQSTLLSIPWNTQTSEVFPPRGLIGHLYLNDWILRAWTNSSVLEYFTWARWHVFKVCTMCYNYFSMFWNVPHVVLWTTRCYSLFTIE